MKDTITVDRNIFEKLGWNKEDTAVEPIVKTVVVNTQRKLFGSKPHKNYYPAQDYSGAYSTGDTEYCSVCGIPSDNLDSSLGYPYCEECYYELMEKYAR